MIGVGMLNEARAWLQRYAAYYAPLWLVLVLLGIRALIANFPAIAPVGASEVTYAMLSFWLWAITINASSRRLVASSGRDSGTPEQRSAEFLFVLFLFFLAVGLHIACFVPDYADFTLVFPSLSMILPVIALGTPSP